MFDRAIVPFTTRQLGLVTRAQALKAGLSARQIGHRLATGEWEVVFDGVYRSVAVPTHHDQRLLAAVLAAGPDAAASHRAAVSLWGLHGFRSAAIEVSRPFVAPHRLPGAIVHRYRDLTPAAVVDRYGVPTTRPARTLMDLGEVAPRLVRRAVEAWLADRLVTIDELHSVAAELAAPWRRGVRLVRAVLADRVLDGPADSHVEALLASVLTRFGLPAPVHHHVVRLPSGLVVELDYAYPAELIALEVDGYGVHLRSREVFEHDRFRQNELEVEGWAVLRFTSIGLRHEAERCARQVARLLEQRRRRSSPLAGVTTTRCRALP